MFIISYYTKKISPLYSQTNLSISVFNSKCRLLYLRDRKIIIHSNKIHGISLYYLISRFLGLLDSTRITVQIFAESQYSQTVTYFLDVIISFRYSQNYTTLKRSQLGIYSSRCLRYLRNYTTLKLQLPLLNLDTSLRHLQNYTTLKPLLLNKIILFGLRYLQNHTTLKLYVQMKSCEGGLRYLQNHTTLKQT